MQIKLKAPKAIIQKWIEMQPSTYRKNVRYGEDDNSGMTEAFIEIEDKFIQDGIERGVKREIRRTLLDRLKVHGIDPLVPIPEKIVQPKKNWNYMAKTNKEKRAQGKKQKPQPEKKMVKVTYRNENNKKKLSRFHLTKNMHKDTDAKNNQ